MSKSEEFKIDIKFNIDSKPIQIDGVNYFSEDVLKLYAKNYLKHKVNVISDEIINEKSFNLERKIEVRQAYNKGAKWYKSKLLKQ